MPNTKKQNSKALTVRANDYPIMATDIEEIKSLIKDNMGVESFNVLDLERIKVPTGGLTVWMVPTVEGEVPMPEIIGIIVKTQTTRQLWLTPFDKGGGQPPQCVCDDGVVGIGDPGNVRAANIINGAVINFLWTPVRRPPKKPARKSG